MAGYPITNLKKAERISAQDAIPVQQDGVTRMFEAGVMDQAVIVKSSGSQSSGIVRKEETFVLKSETLINFTLENAAGRIVQDNEYVDNAEAASGWIIHIVNVSGIQHTVIHGANSWPIPAGETLVFYWTGSRFTLHNVVLNNLTVRGNTKLMNVSAVSALAASNKIPVIGTDDIVKYTTPAAITDGLASKTEVNNALANYQKFVNYGFYVTSDTKYKLAKIKINSKGHVNLKVYISSRIGNVMANDGEYFIKIGYLEEMNKITKINSNDNSRANLSIEKDSDADYYLVFNINTNSSNPIMGNIKIEEVSGAYATVTISEELTLLTETTTEVVNSNNKLVVTETDLQNYLTIKTYVYTSGLTSGTPVVIDNDTNYWGIRAKIISMTIIGSGTETSPSAHGYLYINETNGKLYFMPLQSATQTYIQINITLKK